MGRGQSNSAGMAALATMRTRPGSRDRTAELIDYSVVREQPLLASYERNHGTVERPGPQERKASDRPAQNRPTPRPRRQARRAQSSWSPERRDPHGPAVIQAGDELRFELGEHPLGTINAATGKVSSREKMFQKRGGYIGILDPETGTRHWFNQDGEERIFLKGGKLKKPPRRTKAAAVLLGLSFWHATKALNRGLGAKWDQSRLKYELAGSAQAGADGGGDPLGRGIEFISSDLKHPWVPERGLTEDLKQPWQRDSDLAEIGL